jgi:DNA-directed RNA polymerase specialized sigma24 family protein
LDGRLPKAWLAWGRVGDDPDPYVYRILVNTHASWWRRRWHRETPTGELPDLPIFEEAGFEDRDVLWTALGHFGERERAAVVLRYFRPATQGTSSRPLPRPRISGNSSPGTTT